MESLITLFSIFILCVFMYAYIRMDQINKDYPTSCNILYMPRQDNTVKNRLPHMEVLDHEEHDSKFKLAQFSTLPQGVSEIEQLMPSLNRRHDSVSMVEIGG
uniref:Uncharacterized protein n=1 Tax=viral metagenome TaxID=1070528 RepID=A0A6C0FFK1_9ZZZZ